MTQSATTSDVVAEEDCSTRQRILRLIVEEGPVSAVQLATDLDLTAAGVRRHVGVMLAAGEIVEHHAPAPGRAQRGRPARRYVATARGQASLSDAYSELAADALTFVARLGGDEAVREFARQRVREMHSHHGDAIGTATDVAQRLGVLADRLSGDGFAASVRPLPGGRAVQLCQGHCPVQAVAARFPQLCEAEAQLFSDLLGVHVQRLSTLASGGHVCTTNVPLATVPVPTVPVPTVPVPTVPVPTVPVPTVTEPNDPAAQTEPAATTEGTR